MLDIKIVRTTEPKAKPQDESKLGFGKIFTDHMFLMDYTAGEGWHDARVVPYASLPTRPEELTESARINAGETETPASAVSEAAPPGTAPETPAGPQAEETEQLAVAKDIALNGAQVTSLVQIARSVSLGELDRESAIEIITAAFPFDRTKAEQIIGDGAAPEQEPLPGMKGTAGAGCSWRAGNGRSCWLCRNVRPGRASSGSLMDRRRRSWRP